MLNRLSSCTRRPAAGLGSSLKNPVMPPPIKHHKQQPKAESPSQTYHTKYILNKANVQVVVPHLFTSRFWPPLGYTCSELHFITRYI